MNPVGVGLDGLLALLLIAALAVGVRLSRRLKALRDGQSAFVRSVGELDAAATRAENGLQALRIATQEAHDQLLTRIEAARTLSARLDRAAGEAEAACSRAEALARSPAAAPARPALALVPAAPASPVEPLRRDLILDDEPLTLAPPPAARTPPPAAPAPAAPAPATAPIDDSPLARFTARRSGLRP